MNRPTSEYGSLVLRACLIVAAGFWIYSPVFHGGWLWDDDIYITHNALLNDPGRLWKTWFAPGSLINYFPITATVQFAQWELWGNNTLGYHLTNIFLHVLSGLLVWRLLSKLGLRLAWLGGLLFVVHPTAVESVAWISELKNTLSEPLFLLTLGALIDYEEHKRPRDYLLMLGLFVGTMLCKTTVSMFPVLMLLYVWWKWGRIGWNDLKATVPFFLISLALGTLTVMAEHKYYADRMLHGPKRLDFLSALDCAGLVISFYFAKCLCPVGMLPIYPKWGLNPHALVQFLPWPIVAAVLFYCWQKRQSWGRHALLGLGFFLINLVPFMGFAPTGFMSFTWVMDHFLYVPIIGLIGLAVAIAGRIEKQLTPIFRSLVLGVLAMAIALLAFESHDYAKAFVDEKTILAYTLKNRGLEQK